MSNGGCNRVCAVGLQPCVCAVRLRLCVPWSHVFELCCLHLLELAKVEDAIGVGVKVGEEYRGAV